MLLSSISLYFNDFTGMSLDSIQRDDSFVTIIIQQETSFSVDCLQ